MRSEPWLRSCSSNGWPGSQPDREAGLTGCPEWFSLDQHRRADPENRAASSTCTTDCLIKRFGSTSDEPSGIPSVWFSSDCGRASLGKSFSLCANSTPLRAPTPPRYIWAPETITSVLATAGWLAVLGSDEAADAADVPELAA